MVQAGVVVALKRLGSLALWAFSADCLVWSEFLLTNPFHSDRFVVFVKLVQLFLGLDALASASDTIFEVRASLLGTTFKVFFLLHLFRIPFWQNDTIFSPPAHCSNRALDHVRAYPMHH